MTQNFTTNEKILCASSRLTSYIKTCPFNNLTEEKTSSVYYNYVIVHLTAIFFVRTSIHADVWLDDYKRCLTGCFVKEVLLDSDELFHYWNCILVHVGFKCAQQKLLLLKRPVSVLLIIMMKTWMVILLLFILSIIYLLSVQCRCVFKILILFLFIVFYTY